MSLPIIIIRPQPDCDATVAAALTMGLDARAFPLFEIVPRDWAPPPADTFDALLLGSVNALRQAGPALAAYSGIPAYTVGIETGRAAADAGLTVVASGSGGLQQVLGAVVPGHEHLLRLTGETRVELDPPPGVTIDERVVYSSDTVPMPDECAAILHGGGLVLLHSGEAARHFASECDRLTIDRDRITVAALAPRIAAGAGIGWRTVAIAQSPTNPALLALAADLWQIVPGLRGTV